MRKTFAALTTVAVASLGALVPATSAQAADCSDAMQPARSPATCTRTTAPTATATSATRPATTLNWGDSALSFRSGDTNKASSILNNGNSYEVKFYNGTGDSGGHICLSRSEGWASSLSGRLRTTPAARRTTASAVTRGPAHPTAASGRSDPTRARERTAPPAHLSHLGPPACSRRAEV